METEAKPFYSLTTGRDIQDVGFITTDDGRIGCSPDGMFDDNSGIEIKCACAHTHVGYLLGGVVPETYLLQVHGAMFVTGATQWNFFSYRRGFPPLHVIVKRDEAIQKVLKTALDLFLESFDAALKKLKGE